MHVCTHCWSRIPLQNTHSHTLYFEAIGCWYFWNIIYLHCVVLVTWVCYYNRNMTMIWIYTPAHALKHTLMCTLLMQTYTQHAHTPYFTGTNTPSHGSLCMLGPNAYIHTHRLLQHTRGLNSACWVQRPVYSLCWVAVLCWYCLLVKESCGAWSSTLLCYFCPYCGPVRAKYPLCNTLSKIFYFSYVILSCFTPFFLFLDFRMISILLSSPNTCSLISDVRVKVKLTSYRLLN